MSVHEGNYYLCDHQATLKSSLIRHQKSSPPKYKIHILNETTKKKHIYEISDYKAKRSDILKNHVESLHPGVCYPAIQCDYKAEEKRHLQEHLMSILYKVVS